MVYYDFMKPDCLKDKKALFKFACTKCGKKLTLEDVKEGRVLIDYLIKTINESGLEPELSGIAKRVNKIDNGRGYPAEDIVNKLIDVVKEPLNYVEDLLAAIYRGILFNDAKKDAFLFSAKNRKEYEEIVGNNKNGKSYLERLAKEKEEIVSVWYSKSNDQKIDKQSVWKNYPIPVRESAEAYDTITLIPGGCYDFHRTMISKSNIGMFDTETPIKSYRRYSFWKIHNIYMELKESPVENLLLMEYSLGIGYTNHLYTYLGEKKKFAEIGRVKDIVALEGQLVPFFLRKRISSIVWAYIKEMDFAETAFDDVAEFWRFLSEAISIIWEDVLEVWWYVYFLYQDKDVLYWMQLTLEEGWEKYFCEDMAYSNWIRTCQVHDWRGVKTVNDCFVFLGKEISDIGQEEMFVMNLSCPPKVQYIFLRDCTGNERALYVENYTNTIGQEVLHKTIDSFKKRRFPENNQELYLLYYQLREEEFYKLLEKDKGEFNGTDFKIPSKTQSIKQQHVYAILQREITCTLLTND